MHFFPCDVVWSLLSEVSRAYHIAVAPSGACGAAFLPDWSSASVCVLVLLVLNLGCVSPPTLPLFISFGLDGVLAFFMVFLSFRLLYKVMGSPWDLHCISYFVCSPPLSPWPHFLSSSCCPSPPSSSSHIFILLFSIFSVPNPALRLPFSLLLSPTWPVYP